MLSNSGRFEIDHHTMKLIVGLIALCLASVASYLSGGGISSISASYHADGLARDYFVGSLFAIYALLLTYNGASRFEMILAKVAALAALGVAIFPCECVIHTQKIPGVHGVSAAIMFLCLAVFCYLFYRRAAAKPSAEAARRAVIYMFSGVVIVVSIITLSLDPLVDKAISKVIPRLIFYGEMSGLVAFGVAWLTASRALPILTNQNERINPFS